MKTPNNRGFEVDDVVTVNGRVTYVITDVNFDKVRVMCPVMHVGNWMSHEDIELANLNDEQSGAWLRLSKETF